MTGLTSTRPSDHDQVATRGEQLNGWLQPSVAPPERGLALVAVLVALGILLGLVVPFMLSMGHGQAVAVQRVDEAQAELTSASVRDLLLDQVVTTHVALDKTPGYDSIAEFPAKVELPEALAALGENGRQLLAGEAEDTQRRINLNSASPLVLANLLGSVARLAEKHEADVERLLLDDASKLPDAGVVVVDRELIRYGRRSDRELLDLQRGLRTEEGFAPAVGHVLDAESLVLDYRCVLAVTYPFWERHEGTVDKLVPYNAVSELSRLALVQVAGASAGFTLRELDVFERACTVASVHENGGNWGKPERVFDISNAGATLQVRSAAFLSGGTIVRVRSVHAPEGTGEFNLVWSVEAPSGGPTGTVRLPRAWFLNLLRPLQGSYEPIDTIVEPLVPQAVNINTASREVLIAILENLRQGRRVRPASQGQGGSEPVHGQQQRAEQFGPPLARARAEEIADKILTVGGRGPDGKAVEGGDDAEKGIGAFTGFEDFEKRVMKPLLAEVKGMATQQLMLVYQNALAGRDGNLEMGTAPFTFSSAPVISYRAGGSRNKIAGQVAARHERQGTALVVPPRRVDVVQATQEAFEEAFRLDRKAPFYTTHPINVGALVGADRGTDPSPRHVAHLLADAYPELGFGQARFPSRDGNGSGFKPATATTPLGLRFATHEDMAMANDPEGRDVGKDGAYEMDNTGPKSRGGQPSTGGSNRHDTRSFPFTADAGVAPLGVAFWFRLEDTGPQALYDLAGDQATRDRIKLSVADGHVHLKIFDAAGADPDQQPVNTAPELCAGQWKVPLVGETGFKIEAQTWYHASLSARGNRPGQLALLIDGVPRGESEFRTYLTEDLPAFQPATGRTMFEDNQRYLPFSVESTKGFPDAGVVRIGLELFEYTKKDEKNFYCDRLDSRGGRLSRMDVAEFRPDIPVDGNGKPTKSIEDLTGNAAADSTPKHQNGAAVELYGYSIPIYRNAIWYPGAAQLTEGVGAFSVARVLNSRTVVSASGSRGRPIPMGTGLIDTTVEDLELGEPLVNTANPNQGVPASEQILAGFPQSGGYALVVQQLFDWSVDQDRMEVGGVEVIRYTRRDKDKLTGIQRAVTLPTVTPDNTLGFNGKGRRFVCNWFPNWLIMGSNKKLQELPQYQTYIVPLSLPVTGAVADPRTTGWTEWIQIYDRGDESKSEWVRYDYFDGQHVVRARLGALHAVRFAITNQTQITSGQGGQSGGGAQAPDQPLVYNPPPQGLRNVGIGSIEQVEYDHPIVWQVRNALRSRGDWGTSCRGQSAATQVLPVHRAELDWGNYGALSGRVGRNDRVALVEGTAGPGGSMEWHTVNWVGRRFGMDNPQNTDAQAEKLGPYPFQLVALKGGVGAAFTGPGSRDDRVDARLLDRVVKFPSGELPAAYPDRASFGASLARDDRQLRGVIDELTALTHRVPSLILDADLPAEGQQIIVRDDATVESFGVVVRGGVMAEMPRNGCMVMIDGELIAVDSVNGGTLTVAKKGRGQLQTKPRAHDEGTLVHVLDHVPVAILAGAVNENTHQFATNGLGALPRYGGTVLMGTELLHYTWTHGDQLLEMPSYIDPASESKTKRGLFRGRYGTNPGSAQAGQAVIGFPFRYWDRYRERTEDPELSYFQATYQQGTAYFTDLMWQEQNDEKLVDLQCIVRLDGKGGFADDPLATPSMRKFDQGTVDDHGNPIQRQAEMLEARFFVTYKSGAFDPFTFLVHAWKKAPVVTGVVLSFEGETRILEERVTAR